jgi:hypothetical protein
MNEIALFLLLAFNRTLHFLEFYVGRETDRRNRAHKNGRIDDSLLYTIDTLFT